LKAQLGQPFRELEARLQAAVEARYHLPAWTAEAYAKHKRADRLAAASEAFHVVGWSRTDMVKALGIEIHPLRDDPLPPNGFARWEPWPPQASQHLFMERFRELAHASQSSHVAIPNGLLWTRGKPSRNAILTSSISESPVSQTRFA
jgi:hypothetical protein